MAKHFIRIDENYFITHTFSDDFPEHVEQLLPTDICIKEDGGRHFNFELYREDGLSRYKYVAGEIVETTEEDLSDQLQRIKLEKEMYQLQCELADEDWKVWRQMSSDDEAHKMSDADYTAFKGKRDAVRRRIDEIREFLKGL